MIIVEVWKSNRERCDGRFNLYFFWLYPLALPFCLQWDLLVLLERSLTLRSPDNSTAEPCALK